MFKKSSKIRSIFAVTLALLLTLAFAGCSSSSTSDTGSGGSGSSDSTSVSADTGSADSSSESDQAEFQALLSYVNYDYIETGDESQPKLLRKIETTVTSDKDTEEAKIEALINALATVPDDGSAAETVVDGRVTINFVKISGNNAVIDVSSSGLDNLSEMDEQYFIYQITDSVLNTFDDIDGVRFTVDGTNTDILVTIDISQPFTRDSVSEFLNDSSSSDSSSSDSSSGTASSQSSSDSSSDSTGTSSQSGVVDDSSSSSGSDSGVVDDQQ
ncbi:MAG: GerMN domain-containing protein [Anaerovoracaceae bacterium]|jgi:hypothetical protein